jgi:hypothetical protein
MRLLSNASAKEVVERGYRIEEGRARERLRRMGRTARRVASTRRGYEVIVATGGCVCEVCGVRVRGGDLKAHNAGRQHGRMVRRRLGRDVRGWKRREQTLVRNIWRAWRRCREGRIERAKQWVERWMPESVGDGWEPASWARSGEVAMGWWRKGQGWSPTKHAHFRRLKRQHEKRVEW